MWEIWALLLLLAILAVFVAPRFFRPGPGSGAQQGTLLITGVSPRPDALGTQYVTITGVITGPTVAEHEVYQRRAVDVDNWPTVGELLPVVYSPRNPDNWNLTEPAG
ncbi:hypothetical protein [Mycolicibacter senuensis]|uniref:DUF3592 domain-containing protein n=1 Tax=Mycolicibacter senuensis TaxID=386913 RepID=A0A7I9XFL7_9MYCO|nr:hypothetical protein [Mycolicibacter senuensis]ORW65240.1 hypothetical protein AWC24_16445 [Mycolicibacter senuensis]GFG68761.1 hypothetical protein MSEN_04810 [Mycolicibacter senuensis]